MRQVIIWNLALEDWATFKVGDKVPDGRSGIWRIKHVVVEEDDAERLIHASQGRDPGTGAFVTLQFLDGGKWRPMMSDTRAEILEHYEAIDAIAWPNSQRVLINGLGLGVVLNAALKFDHVEHVDVVDNSEDVIKLIGPVYASDLRVTIHHADAFNMRWPRNTSWDIVWSDIWPTISSSNLPEMTKLKRKYGSRARWQGCWGEDRCRQARDEEHKTPDQQAVEAWRRFEQHHGPAMAAQIKEFLESQGFDHIPA